MTATADDTSWTSELGGEDARLNALYRYDVLDTPSEESFDRITRLAKSVLQAPMAMVSLVDRHRQWFKSRQGTDTAETPRDISFCTHTIRKAEPLVVRDALEDARFRDSPLVTGPPHVRCYVGVPLRTPDGHNIGALCVNDTRPREVTQEQISFLEDLARLVVDELELRMLASVDSLTGIMTVRAFMAEGSKEIARSRRHARPLACIMFDIDHFKKINDSYGHPTGDEVLAQVGGLCRSLLRTTDFAGRLGGEEFGLILPETGVSATEVAEALRQSISALAIVRRSQTITVSASFGVTVLDDRDGDIKSMLARADAALYHAKTSGRNRVHWAEPCTASPRSAA